MSVSIVGSLQPLQRLTGPSLHRPNLSLSARLSELRFWYCGGNEKILPAVSAADHDGGV